VYDLRGATPRRLLFHWLRTAGDTGTVYWAYALVSASPSSLSEYDNRWEDALLVYDFRGATPRRLLFHWLRTPGDTGTVYWAYALVSASPSSLSEYDNRWEDVCSCTTFEVRPQGGFSSTGYGLQGTPARCIGRGLLYPCHRVPSVSTITYGKTSALVRLPRCNPKAASLLLATDCRRHRHGALGVGSCICVIEFSLVSKTTFGRRLFEQFACIE
jgi:hypothetical protein